MTLYPDEVIRYTRDDLLQTLAESLGSSPDDHRIVDAYDQIIGEWSLTSDDPDAAYFRFFQDGPVASHLDLVAAQTWAKGRVLI